MHMLFGILYLSLPLMVVALLVYLIHWLFDLSRTLLRGRRNGSLGTALSAKKNRWLRGGVLWLLTVTAFIYLEFLTPAIRHIELADAGLSQEEILSEMPDIAVTDEDLELMDSIIFAPEMQQILAERYPQDPSRELAQKLTAAYNSKPSDDCKINVTNTGVFRSVSVEFDGNPRWTLFFYYSDTESGEFELCSKSITYYEVAAESESHRYENIEARYGYDAWGDEPYLTKEVLQHDWFEWISRYMAVFYQ